eukprot:scaffold170691_cov22-Tisochrysis_lutea.AAC.1
MESRERETSVRNEAAEETVKETAEEGMDMEELLGQIQQMVTLRLQGCTSETVPHFTHAHLPKYCSSVRKLL